MSMPKQIVQVTGWSSSEEECPSYVPEFVGRRKIGPMSKQGVNQRRKCVKMPLKLCRACLVSGDTLYNFENNERVVQAFLDLANIRIDLSNSAMPQSVCEQCLNKLSVFAGFRKQVIANDKLLTERIFGNIPQIDTIKRRITRANTQPITQSLSEENFEYDEIKSEPSEDVEDLPLAEVFENSVLHTYRDQDDDDVHDDDEGSKVKRKKKVKAEKSPKKNTTKPTSRSKRPGRTPRKYIQIDPEQITVISLSMEEQVANQQAEGEKPAYLAMPHRCEKCFKGFNFERKLKSHDEKYHKADSAYKCGVCSRTMRNSASLALHLQTHQLTYQCNKCFVRFTEKPRALAHYKADHEGVPVEWPCKHCDQVFRNRSSLNGHLRSRHTAAARPRCPVCQKTFVTRDSLQEHTLIHTGEKNYACQVCDKRFRLRQSVAVHMLSHSSDRMFYCAPCDVSFKSRSAHANHMTTAIAHAPTHAASQFRCAVCGRGFTCAARLRAHAARHARAQGPAPAPGRARRTRVPPPASRAGHAARARYVCHRCGRGFAARRTLDNHVLAHSGARPHACGTCNARFTQRATLRAHTQRIHNKSVAEKL